MLGAEAAGPIATGTFKGREVVKLDAFVVVQTCADNLSPQHQFLRLGSLCKRQTFAETLTLMKLPDMENARTIVSTWLALALTPLFGAEAAGPTATGTIEGRVLNVDNGRYVTGARVTVESTGLETFTDSSGFYRLLHVPSGTAKVSVLYTGVRPGTQITL